jgi:hypothetical protein
MPCDFLHGLLEQDFALFLQLDKKSRDVYSRGSPAALQHSFSHYQVILLDAETADTSKGKTWVPQQKPFGGASWLQLLYFTLLSQAAIHKIYLSISVGWCL